ncbi:1-aminocyclopropane-1-carboxylate oxidase-like [Andrographis paniculata]|uniref:1-aminocyclopropane-1-carboxylate oxidase-like n=1 Tax=Andrographis paniculata TaxID=175694 RepID=UPI0021E72056|nr:1-aminocyclopropane-1-carboxylate oxidase-like [Andrographis paniculata]
MEIPTVDLSPFLKSSGDGAAAKNNAITTIRQACEEYGFFQIANHGVPLHLISRALQLSGEFLAFPDDQKLQYAAPSEAPLPAGYRQHPPESADKLEYFLMFDPKSGFNVMPPNPPDFREVLEEMFGHFRKTGELMEQILNDCFELPPDFLKTFNGDRSWDFMVALRYFPISSESDGKNGLLEHEDSNIFTFVIQDDVGGLEVKKAGEWIPVVPNPDTIVVNIGDVLQVLSNKKFKSATHRVARPKGRDRHSFAFFYNIEGEKWIEPLAKFTEDVGEAAKYKRFQYKEYQAMRMKNKTNPPERPEDEVRITYYELPAR